LIRYSFSASEYSCQKMSKAVQNGECSVVNNNNSQTCKHDDHGPYLFCPDILKSVSFTHENLSKFQNPISPTSPGDGLLMRPLRIDDYEKGYLQLLAQLTVVGSLTQKDFENTFYAMKAARNTYYVVVVEDLNTSRIVGATTLLIEQKFIHDAGLRGRIEDVVVDNGYRSKQLGKLLVETCTELGKQYLKCYKMSLDCKEPLINFYGQFGYKREPGINTLIQRIEYGKL